MRRDVPHDRARRRPLRPDRRDDAGPRRPAGDRPGARPVAGPGRPRRRLGALAPRRRGPVPPGALPAAARALGARARAPRRARGASRRPAPIASTRSPRRCRRRSRTARRAPATSASSTWTGRRSTLEWVVARAAEREPGVEIRRGVDVTALETRRIDGRVHVNAVRTDAGDRLAGDLVVDAMGRGSTLPKLLAAAGGDPVHEEAEDTGFLYYTRHFRGEVPEFRGPVNTPVGTFSILTLPGRQRHLERHALRIGRRPPAEGAARPGQVDRAGARVPAPRALARRRADHAGDADGRRRRPPALVQRRPAAARPGEPRRRVGLHEPVDGARHLARPRARRAPAPGRPRAASDVEPTRVRSPPPRPSCGPWYDSTVLVDRARMAEIVALRTGEAPPLPSTSARASAARCRPAMSRDGDVFRAGAGDHRLPVTPAVTSSRAPASPSACFEAAAGAVAGLIRASARGAAHASALTHRQLIETLLPLSAS